MYNLKNEIKNSRKKVLGVGVDIFPRREVLEIITDRVENHKSHKALHIVTAYSEFFVRATKDPSFLRILNQADLVLPDGVGPLSAIDYLESINKGDSNALKLIKGGLTGLKVLFGKVGETVSGVWLFSKLLEISAEKGWKVYLLGGFGDVSYRLEKQLLNKYPKLKIKSDPGEQNLDGESSGQENNKVIDRINTFAPDILFVAYGPVKQEKWIAANRDKFQAKIVIGVGGTYDELTGKVKPAPQILQRMGLKWLWRLKEEPKRLGRILNAFPVFPILIFKESLRMP